LGAALPSTQQDLFNQTSAQIARGPCEFTLRQLSFGTSSFSPRGANAVPFSDFTFAYFSPETLLPATSIVATIAGILMMLGRGSLRYLMRLSKGGHRTARGIAATSKPHLRRNDETYTNAADDLW